MPRGIKLGRNAGRVAGRTSAEEYLGSRNTPNENGRYGPYWASQEDHAGIIDALDSIHDLYRSGEITAEQAADMISNIRSHAMTVGDDFETSSGDAWHSWVSHVFGDEPISKNGKISSNATIKDRGLYNKVFGIANHDDPPRSGVWPTTAELDASDAAYLAGKRAQRAKELQQTGRGLAVAGAAAGGVAYGVHSMKKAADKERERRMNQKIETRPAKPNKGY